MKRKSEKELLHQQLELLAEESKDTLPASNEVSENSIAMVKISSELFKRKCLAVVLFIALVYFVKRLTVQRK